jgi:hypothetical protein
MECGSNSSHVAIARVAAIRLSPEKLPKLRTWVRFPSPAQKHSGCCLIFHFFQISANPCFFREMSVVLFRSNLVSVANKRVEQILRRFDPWSSSRSEAREASNVEFDTKCLLHSTRRSPTQVHASYSSGQQRAVGILARRAIRLLHTAR